MRTTLLARTPLVVTTLATIGLLLGVLAAYALTMREERFMADATLAMLPAPEVPPEQALDFWEVLNRGQATRTAALALEDAHWLDTAAPAAGVSKSELTLRAGAVPDTTLISVTMEADSRMAAELALDSVLKNAAGPAARVSGPFKLETIASADGSAEPLGPNRIQVLGALGLAGLLIGAGAGLLISRSVQGWSARHHAKEKRVRSRIPIPLATGESGGIDDAEPRPAEIPLR